MYPVFQTNTVYGVFEHDDVIYRGGWFSLFRWTGSDWETFGGGIGGDTGTLFAADFTTYGGVLVIGGRFPTAGGTPVYSIATWDGAVFGALGGGVDGEIQALVTYDGDLIAGGLFDYTGSGPARNIARWDGSGWHPLGSGVYDAIPDGTADGVQEMVVWQGDLYVAGDFTHAGGVEVSYVARWDGSRWSDVGGGVSMIGGGPTGLRGIDVHEGDLVIVGCMDFAGGVEAINIARWDGVVWSPVGSGSDPIGGFLDLRTAALSVASYGGLLYVGADFSETVGPKAEAIAVWDGRRWRPVGRGLDYSGWPTGPMVRDLEVCGGSLLMGGIFDEANNKETDNMARYTDCDAVAGSVLEEHLDGPLQVHLSPNPTTASFHYAIRLERQANVNAVLYDVEGRQIQSLLNQSLSAGTHSFQDDLDKLGARVGGVYFLRVEAEGSLVTRKLTLIP
ncbi:T9SS type A sorting domain-containing protein [Candidatus Eisenbacteria bacterium]|uniref:T9SS type A sorting domain-containing protein n=1 Tax=Eiseniibacteriota bacterium TaxID=2212470 RepID=A0ABV6YN13_UNCEI